MKILTIENIVSALGANLVNGDEFKEKEILGVAIDSRKVEKDFSSLHSKARRRTAMII